MSLFGVQYQSQFGTNVAVSLATQRVKWLFQSRAFRMETFSVHCNPEGIAAIVGHPSSSAGKPETASVRNLLLNPVIKFIGGRCKWLLTRRNNKRKDRFASMRHGDGSRRDTLLGPQRSERLLVSMDSVIICDC